MPVVLAFACFVLDLVVVLIGIHWGCWGELGLWLGLPIGHVVVAVVALGVGLLTRKATRLGVLQTFIVSIAIPFASRLVFPAAIDLAASPVMRHFGLAYRGSCC